MDTDTKVDSSAPDEPNDTRFVIRQTVGETGRLVEELDAVFSMCDEPPLFQAGSALVRVGVMPAGVMAKLLPEHRHEPPAAIRQATQADLRRLASRVARFERWDARREVWVDSEPLPASLAAYLDAHGEWRVPMLRGLSSVPLLRSDGIVSDDQGYDPGTGMYYVGQVRVRLPAEIKRRDALDAWERVMEPFCEFPFATDIDRAVFAAYLLGLAVRPLVPMQPALLFGAPTFGTGKTKLATAAGLLVYGKEPVVLAPRGEGRDSEQEMGKRLATLAALGVELAVLDNMVGILSSPSLAAALTQSVITDRLFGRNDRMISGLRPNIAVTANNAEVGRDLVRRVLWCYLDSGEPQPEARSGFRYPNLEAHIRRHRPRLLEDLLTVLAGYMRAGRPVTFGASLGSFEDWYSMVAECVGWLGMPDPVSSQEAVRAVDDEAADFDELVTTWHHLYGNSAKEPGEVFRDLQYYMPPRPVEIAGTFPLEHEPQHELLAKALQRVGANKPEKLGMLLKTLVNRSFEVRGVGLVRVRRSPANRRRWQITG